MLGRLEFKEVRFTELPHRIVEGMFAKALSLVSLAYVVYLGITHLYNPSLQSLLRSHIEPFCTGPIASNAHRVRYVGHDAVDIPMCLLVNFFTLALSPEDKDFRTYTLDFLGAVPLLASVAMLDIDGHIQSTALAVFTTAVVGTVCQTVGGGVAYPIYFLLSILFFGTSKRVRTKDSRRAESVLFSLLFGNAALTLLMCISDNVYVTAAWQAFPLVVALLQTTYLALHPDLGPDQNGLVNHITISLGIAGAAMTHIILIHKDPLHSLNHLLNLRLPSFSEFDARSSIPNAALYFLQWDGALVYLSTFIFGISTMPYLSILDILLSIALVGGGSVFVGIGGSIGLLWLWREQRISNSTRGVPVSRKTHWSQVY